MFCVHLRRMYILLFLSVVFCMCNWFIMLVKSLLIDFLPDSAIYYWKWDIEIFKYYFIFPFNVLVDSFFSFKTLSLKICFSKYTILGWQFFSFKTLSISFHCFWAPMVSVEKTTVNIIEDNLYVATCCFHNSIFLFEFDSFIMICRSVGLFEFTLLEVHWDT